MPRPVSHALGFLSLVCRPFVLLPRVHPLILWMSGQKLLRFKGSPTTSNKGGALTTGLAAKPADGARESAWNFVCALLARVIALCVFYPVSALGSYTSTSPSGFLEATATFIRQKVKSPASMYNGLYAACVSEGLKAAFAFTLAEKLRGMVARLGAARKAAVRA